MIANESMGTIPAPNTPFDEEMSTPTPTESTYSTSTQTGWTVKVFPRAAISRRYTPAGPTNEVNDTRVPVDATSQSTKHRAQPPCPTSETLEGQFSESFASPARGLLHGAGASTRFPCVTNTASVDLKLSKSRRVTPTLSH